MPQFQLNVWVTRDFPRGFTHVIAGSFADPQSSTQAATDLFCYDRNTGVGAFFATVKNGRLDDGTPVPDGPHKVGGNHTFGRRWTHIVYVPQAGTRMLLFYDAASGIGEFHETDGRGGLTLRTRKSNWRTSWRHIIAGQFGTANLLFYDAANGVGEFYAVNKLGAFRGPIKSFAGWRNNWHSIMTGNFSGSPHDDLLFYDKEAGFGEFHIVRSNSALERLASHDNWRKSWQHVVSGQFLQDAAFDGLFFYEEGSFHAEFYSTDGHGGISRIDVDPGNQFRLPWQAILSGQFVPNLGIISNSSFCNYHADGVLRYFFFEPATIQTVIDLNGRWTDGSTRSAVISSVFTFLTIDLSAFSRPAAQGSILDHSTIQVTFPDDNTFTGILQSPGTIRWSNRSSWTKI